MSQLGERGTHGPAADLELLGKPGFHQPETGRKAPTQYLFAQRIGDAPVERTPVHFRPVDP